MLITPVLHCSFKKTWMAYVDTSTHSYTPFNYYEPDCVYESHKNYKYLDGPTS